MGGARFDTILHYRWVEPAKKLFISQMGGAYWTVYASQVGEPGRKLFTSQVGGAYMHPILYILQVGGACTEVAWITGEWSLPWNSLHRGRWSQS